MSSSSPGNPRSLKRLSQKRTVAPHRPILAAIPGALRPSAACWMICARRTSPAPSLCERVIRPSLCASSSLNARTRRVIATSPARTGAPSNAQDSEKSHPTCRMHHLGTVFRSLLGADNELLAFTAAVGEGPCAQLSRAITRERGDGTDSMRLVANLIDWLEGPRSETVLHGSAGGRSEPILACVQAMRTDFG